MASRLAVSSWAFFHVDYAEHAFLQSVARAAFQPNRVRLSPVVHPAPGISAQQFSQYWLKEHGRLFMSLDIARKNLTKYEQVSSTLTPMTHSGDR